MIYDGVPDMPDPDIYMGIEDYAGEAQVVYWPGVNTQDGERSSGGKLMGVNL